MENLASFEIKPARQLHNILRVATVNAFGHCSEFSFVLSQKNTVITEARGLNEIPKKIYLYTDYVVNSL